MNLATLVRIVDDPNKVTLEAHDYRAIREAILEIQTMADEREVLRRRLAKAILQRDAVQRSYCIMAESVEETALEVAARKGWDCFDKEKTVND